MSPDRLILCDGKKEGVWFLGTLNPFCIPCQYREINRGYTKIRETRGQCPKGYDIWSVEYREMKRK